MARERRGAATGSRVLFEDFAMLRRLSALSCILLLAGATGLARAADEADPVVARVNGTELHKSDVEAMQQTLPPQYRQAPFEQIYPALLEQLVTVTLLTQEGRKDKLADDPEVKRKVAQLTDSVIQGVYVDRLIKTASTEEKLRQRYDADIKASSPQEQVDARHILVKTEEEAKAIIAQLDKGADFAKLAKEKSLDSSKENGGDLGFFSREEMVPPFSEAAFNLKKGEYTKTPVHSDYGWHVIKLEDRREAAPPSFEDSKDQLTNEVAREVIGEKLKELRGKAKIETFALDGSPLPPKQ
jgi:peptidyl-prolyl cis-trans isomerase C